MSQWDKIIEIFQLRLFLQAMDWEIWFF